MPDTERAYRKRLSNYLDEIGATNIVYDPNGRGRHARLLFKYQGKDLAMVISRSPSDHRAHHKAITVIRRLTGRNLHK